MADLPFPQSYSIEEWTSSPQFWFNAEVKNAVYRQNEDYNCTFPIQVTPGSKYEIGEADGVNYMCGDGCNVYTNSQQLTKGQIITIPSGATLVAFNFLKGATGEGGGR